jgi:hypothetical protein
MDAASSRRETLGVPRGADARIIKTPLAFELGPEQARIKRKINSLKGDLGSGPQSSPVHPNLIPLFASLRLCGH